VILFIFADPFNPENPAAEHAPLLDLYKPNGVIRFLMCWLKKSQPSPSQKSPYSHLLLFILL